MNFRLLAKLLGILSLLLGGFMLLSLAWANPNFARHTDPTLEPGSFETEGFRALLLSATLSSILGMGLYYWGRQSQKSKLYRKEAMAVVGLSWILATALGALPFVLSGTGRGPSIRVAEETRQVFVAASKATFWRSWEPVELSSPEEFALLKALAESNARGFSARALSEIDGVEQPVAVFEGLCKNEKLSRWLVKPGDEADAPADRASHYRSRWVRMGVADSLFEAQSGFSTTGATVICDLEDPYLVPHCILFWRASTHFLGGLGIIVLFVVLLGQGSAGKALMRAEMPGPTHDNTSTRMQQTAWKFAVLYVGLNIVLALVLKLLGMTTFDSLCHAFATMATGGFSTYNASLGHFAQSLEAITHAKAIEYVVIAFMVLAGTNFTLLFLVLIGQANQVVKDVEWRTYLAIIGGGTLAILSVGFYFQDPGFETTESGFRNSLFQVVSVLTTTGFGTSDFDQWGDLSRGILFLLMFIGGCAGSTGGGMKVIRHVLFFKILGLEAEQAYHPKVVQSLRLSGSAVEDQSLRHSILVYFSLVLVLFAAGWIAVVAFEPSSTWEAGVGNKLLDSASAVAATLNNIGPGLGVVGPTQNYAEFGFLSKVVFIGMMMLGRLEIFPILVLFMPGFWRDQ